MADNGLEHALKAIDPVARAMLDLSIRRRLPDSSIADLAQMPPDELVRWRGEVLDQLGSQIGLTGPDARDQVRVRLEAIDPSAWVGTGQASAPAPAKPEKPVKPPKPPKPPKAPKPAKAPKQAKAPKPKVERQRPSRRLLGLLALLVVVVIIVAAISLAGDDEPEPAAPLPTTTTQPTSTDSSTTTTEEPPTTSTTTPTPPTTAPVELAPLPGMPDRGSATATVSGSGEERTVEVQLKGMPAPGGGSGVYALWLYNTLIGAQPLGTTDSGSGTITARLPADAADFRFLDLSRESEPGDRVHSGISIRRAELAPLLAAE
jgi:hypothetical protein